MTVRAAPPLPRSGRLMTGGANSLELLWAILALAAISTVAAIAGIGWSAVWVEARLAGTTWDVPITHMPGLLLDLAAGSTPEPVAQAVRRPWRPVTVAATMGLLAVAAVVQAVRRWLDWQDSWRHRQRARDRTNSRVWARHHDLAPLLARTPRPTADEPRAGGRPGT